MRQIKLIWDFRGPDAKKIAEHHQIHLKQYITLEHLTECFTGTETINEVHTLAFMVVNESIMTSIRDNLKPHRGVLYTNS